MRCVCIFAIPYLHCDFALLPTGSMLALYVLQLTTFSALTEVQSTKAPTTPQYHIPFLGGCCADVTAIGEYKGVAHLFKENTGVPGGHGLGFAHYVSKDFVNWVNLPSILQPGAADGSVNFLHPEGPTILWDCTRAAFCAPPTTSTCAVVDEHAQMALSCPRGVITNITFASYGTPSGDCSQDGTHDDFAISDCHASNSLSVVRSLCVGNQYCEFTVGDGLFSGCKGCTDASGCKACDPCHGIVKRLAVALTCSSTDSLDAHMPTPTTARSDLDSEPEAKRGRSRSRDCHSGDAAIIGVARAADPSDPNLTHWVKDSRNPIYVAPAGTDCYAGPSNLWRTKDGKMNMVMIYDTKTGLFSRCVCVFAKMIV